MSDYVPSGHYPLEVERKRKQCGAIGVVRNGNTGHILLYSNQAVNKFCCLASVLRFTMVSFALVGCAGNGGVMKC